MKKITVYLIMFFIFSLSARATHLIGGEMTYECIAFNAGTGEYMYEISLVIYRDCGPNNTVGTFFDSTAAIGVFREGELYKELSVDYPGFFTLIDTQIDDPCTSAPALACIQKAVYVTTVLLKFDGKPFDISYQRCCRNGSINNLINPDVVGTTLTIHIPVPEGGSGGNCNSSPVFNQLPPSFVCLGSPINLDFSATDPDGDQLVYSLCTPFTGASIDDPMPIMADPPPYTDVSYSPGFNDTYPFPSSPPVSIDPETGMVTGTATSQGIYAIGICVSEYRDGVLLSKVIRDYQIFIYICPPPEAQFAAQTTTQFCEGMEITFNNTSLYSNSFFWDFGVDGTLDDTSNLFEPTFTFPATGYYDVMLVASPGNPCADTVFVTYFVQPPVEVDFDYFGPNCEDTVTYSFVPSGTIDEGIFVWEFGGNGLVDQLYPPDINFPVEGNYEITLSYNVNECMGSVTKTLTVPPEIIAGIQPQIESCTGLELSLVNQSFNASDYQWTVSKADFTGVSTLMNPVIPVPFEGSFDIRLIASYPGACPDTAYAVYNAYPVMFPEFIFDEDTICFNDHSINFYAGGVFQPEASFFWDFGESANIGESTNQNVENIWYAEPGTYPVSLTISENFCIKTFTDSISILPNPQALFLLSDTAGCVPLNVQFINVSSAATPLNYTWTFGDGFTSDEQNPMYNYEVSGSYYPALKVETTNGCIDSDQYQFPSSIEVFPLPVPGFIIDPPEVQIEYPHISLIDLSQGAIDVYYVLSNGDTVYIEDSRYSFSQGGIYSVVQKVENEYGCVDESEKTILVKGLLFYMPNTFTPNGDGFNDVLIAMVTGSADYHIEIYNRIGNIVFSSDDLLRGWDGENAQEGVYNYVVLITDKTGVVHRLKGSVLLLR